MLEVRLFAVCAPGLEPALEQEVRMLPGLAGCAAEPGGVALWGGPELVGSANLWLRSASRVLLRLGRFRAVRLPQIVQAVAAVPWEQYLRGAQVEASATCHKCRIYHSGAAAERVQLGIAARLGPGPQAAEAPRVLLRGERDEWEVSLDTSGALLHRRGYRQEAGEAPLRETLAAGLLLLAGYAGGPLLDLCSGAGTFAIEAALLRRRIAPGLRRSFAFEAWPSHEAARWERQRAEAEAQVLPEDEAPAILGVDLDPEVVARARANAARAGVARTVYLRVADLFDYPAYANFVAASGPGLLVTANPPYGRRLGRRDEQPALYRRLGRHLRAHLTGRRVLILAGHRAATAALALGLPPLRVRHGGLIVEVLTGVLKPGPLPGAAPASG